MSLTDRPLANLTKLNGRTNVISTFNSPTMAAGLDHATERDTSSSDITPVSSHNNLTTFETVARLTDVYLCQASASRMKTCLW